MLPAARVGDTGAPHIGLCPGIPVINVGSPNVMINGRPAATVGSATAPHVYQVGQNCVPHVSTVLSGSKGVFINGRPAAHVGSPLGPLCTTINKGSNNVFV